MMKELLADAHHRLMVEWAAHPDKLGAISQHDFCTHAIAALRPMVGELAEIKEEVREYVHDGGDFNWAEACVLIRAWREDAEFLLRMFVRKECGCLALDCTTHGAYVGEDLDRLDAMLDAARATAAAERG